jgi:hypothetical protein
LVVAREAPKLSDALPMIVTSASATSIVVLPFSGEVALPEEYIYEAETRVSDRDIVNPDILTAAEAVIAVVVDYTYILRYLFAVVIAGRDGLPEAAPARRSHTLRSEAGSKARPRSSCENRRSRRYCVWNREISCLL